MHNNKNSMVVKNRRDSASSPFQRLVGTTPTVPEKKFPVAEVAPLTLPSPISLPFNQIASKTAQKWPYTS